MVLALAGDGFGLADFVVGLSLDVIAEFLFVDDPAVVLALMSVVILFFGVPVGGKAAVQSSLDALDLVVPQLVPN